MRMISHSADEGQGVWFHGSWSRTPSWDRSPAKWNPLAAGRLTRSVLPETARPAAAGSSAPTFHSSSLPQFHPLHGNCTPDASAASLRSPPVAVIEPRLLDIGNQLSIQLFGFVKVQVPKHWHG